MISITKMLEEHLDMVHEVELDCFTIPWSKNELRKEITENKLAIYFVAMEDDKVVGYAGMWHVVTEGHITNIAVRESHRGLKIGSKLLEKLISEAARLDMVGLTLEVRISNLAAQKLYSNHGFKPEGFRKNYYHDTHEDAIVMWKYL